MSKVDVYRHLIPVLLKLIMYKYFKMIILVYFQTSILGNMKTEFNFFLIEFKIKMYLCEYDNKKCKKNL